MLTVRQLNASYGRLRILRDVSFSVGGGEVLCLMGRNGAGKTTTLKSIMGLIPDVSGRIAVGDVEVDIGRFAAAAAGIGYVPQGRRLFKEMTVRENLEVGMLASKSRHAMLEKALDYFPVLEERMTQIAGTLSGGEQTMVAIARALCLNPRVIMFDEPTEGLMPSMIATIREAVLRLKKDGVAVLLVEQRADAVLPVADRVIFMDHGTVQAEADVDAIKADPQLIRKYLGVSS